MGSHILIIYEYFQISPGYDVKIRKKLTNAIFSEFILPNVLQYIHTVPMLGKCRIP